MRSKRLKETEKDQTLKEKEYGSPTPRADLLRAQLQKRAAKPAPTPSEAMTAAAETMINALNAALVLIEHVDHRARNTLERRVPKSRRDYDEFDDVP